MSKHTPGPWKAVNANESGWSVVSLTEPHSERYPDHRKAITGWGSVNQSKEDAYLIAAAPELVEALQLWKDWAEGDSLHGPTFDVIWGKVIAALAKAKVKP
jgi:hypothetical protein